MDCYIDKGKITINRPVNFCAKHILDCGQVFRYQHYGSYSRVVTDRHCADIYMTEGNKAVIECDDEDYFYNYFDLATDYGAIINQININPLMERATGYGSGIRILKGDLAEIIISFIISANNNIGRIKRSLNLIADSLGSDMGGYRAFPTPGALAAADEDFFNRCGCGYRSRYIVSTANSLVNSDILTKARQAGTNDAKEMLLSLMGVGTKVADCILLFGLGRTDVFPTDVWINKVYTQDFGGRLTDRAAISDYFVRLFGGLAGYAQQYLFYYKREYGKTADGGISVG